MADRKVIDLVERYESSIALTKGPNNKEMISASRLRIHDRIMIDDTIYEIVKRTTLKRQKHGFPKIEFTLQSADGIRIYVCTCVDELLLVNWDLKEPDCD